MALARRDWRFKEQTANRAICAMVPQRQNREWIDCGKNDLDTRQYGRS